MSQILHLDIKYYSTFSLDGGCFTSYCSSCLTFWLIYLHLINFMSFCYSKNIYNYIQILLLLLFWVWRRTKITNWIAIVTTMHRVPVHGPHTYSRSCFWIKIQSHLLTQKTICFPFPKEHWLTLMVSIFMPGLVLPTSESSHPFIPMT